MIMHDQAKKVKKKDGDDVNNAVALKKSSDLSFSPLDNQPWALQRKLQTNSGAMAMVKNNENPIQRRTDITHNTSNFTYNPAAGAVTEPVGVYMSAYLDPLDPILGSATGGAGSPHQVMITHLNTIYGFDMIRGHLLNHDLGGFGVASNLFPITKAANNRHKDTVEKHMNTALKAANAHRVAGANNAADGIHYTVKVTGAIDRQANLPQGSNFVCHANYVDNINGARAVGANILDVTVVSKPRSGVGELDGAAFNSDGSLAANSPISAPLGTWNHGGRSGDTPTNGGGDDFTDHTGAGGEIAVGAAGRAALPAAVGATTVGAWLANDWSSAQWVNLGGTLAQWLARGGTSLNWVLTGGRVVSWIAATGTALQWTGSGGTALTWIAAGGSAPNWVTAAGTAITWSAAGGTAQQWIDQNGSTLGITPLQWVALGWNAIDWANAGGTTAAYTPAQWLGFGWDAVGWAHAWGTATSWKAGGGTPATWYANNGTSQDWRTTGGTAAEWILVGTAAEWRAGGGIAAEWLGAGGTALQWQAAGGTAIEWLVAGGTALQWAPTGGGVAGCTPAQWAGNNLTDAEWIAVGGTAILWAGAGGTLNRWVSIGGNALSWGVAGGNTTMFTVWQWIAAGWSYTDWTTAGGILNPFPPGAKRPAGW
jgi:hypothetical protein